MNRSHSIEIPRTKQPFWRRATLCVVGVLVASPCSQLAAEDRIRFDRDIRPILSDMCFPCHGPDSASREADLRLDQKEDLFGVLDAGDAEHSEIWQRIVATDDDERMPPESFGRTLSERERDLLRQWIDSGAAWEEHWAYVVPEVPETPEVNAESWVQNGIDPFVLRELEQRGWSPSPTASKETLLRRVTFDLTGLPPTIAEMQAFEADDSPTAYETVVDRLLESQRYGERMASVWLDAARYADSHGYSLDRRRVMWPWRDWVIRAYNDNMPFDQFTLEQIAGDMLDDAAVSQVVATGFNRNHPIQSEGGVIDEEYRVETVVDRVETTGAVFLGLTIGCSRCHDHKYESLTQREFYQFYAFFNNVPESAHVGNRDNDADKPFLTERSVLFDEQVLKLERAIALARERLDRTSVEPEQAKISELVWIDDSLPEGAQPFGNGSGPSEFLFVDADKGPVSSGKSSSYRVSQGLGQHGFTGATPLLVAEGATFFTDVFLDPENPPRQIMLQWHGPNGWEHRAYWGDNQIDWGADKTSSRRHQGELPKAGEWVRLEIEAREIGLQAGDQVDGWAFTQFDGGVYWDRAGVKSIEPTPAERELRRLENELRQLQDDVPTVMVMAEMDPRRKTYVLNRGQYDQPSGDAVLPGIPEVLGQLSPDSEGSGQADRLALARWLVSDRNPLTARVTVNRFWQMYFGTGLVSTPEDFGTQGTRPSHPELLDWLAIEFKKSGWDVKAMQKLIVMSATYQQSSRITPELLERDPKNVWLARGPRFRLPAEMIRDNALAISGLLVERIGGPSVRPYQPAGLWDDVVYGNVPRFKQDHGEKLYRRSLYTYWKRSVPPPNLQIFDAPSREACVLSRPRTNTPLAALVLMNDPTFVESAKKLAERAWLEAGETSDERLTMMFRLATSRRPTERELGLMNELHDSSLKSFSEDPESAKELLGVGETAVDETLDPVKIAALTTIANALLSLDETISKN